MRKNTDFSVFFAFLVGSTGLVRSGATEYSRGVLRGVQANGGERVLLYQIGIAFARGGADKSAGLYDCYTQVSIASPQVRADGDKKRDTVFTVPQWWWGVQGSNL